MNVKEELYKALVNDPDEHREGLHVTQVAKLLREDGCKRQVYYELTEPSTPHDAEAVGIFFRGQAFHRELAYRLSKMGWTVEHQLDGSPHGRFDAFKDGMLLDFKTSSFIPSSRYGQTAQATFEKYYSHQINQVRVYASMIQSQLGVKVNNIYVVFLDVTQGFRGLEDLHFYAVDVGDLSELMKRVEQISTEIKTDVAMGRLPPRNVGWPCQHCSFLVKCFGEKD